MSYGADPTRAAILNQKLADEYAIGRISEAISLIKLDTSQEFVVDLIREYPWVLITDIRFTLADEYSTEVTPPATPTENTDPIHQRRKRRKKSEIEQDGCAYALVYLGKRSQEFYHHFESLALVPGLNCTSFIEKDRMHTQNNLESNATQAQTARSDVRSSPFFSEPSATEDFGMSDFDYLVQSFVPESPHTDERHSAITSHRRTNLDKTFTSQPLLTNSMVESKLNDHFAFADTSHATQLYSSVDGLDSQISAEVSTPDSLPSGRDTRRPKVQENHLMLSSEAELAEHAVSPPIPGSSGLGHVSPLSSSIIEQRDQPVLLVFAPDEQGRPSVHTESTPLSVPGKGGDASISR
ncbi:hypothetical protein HDU93_003954 [Gonapodya sp. JEL0774]|nr:hypothetical protein HDU93_003954 [Gonapodya sp. JEL0774]